MLGKVSGTHCNILFDYNQNEYIFGTKKCKVTFDLKYVVLFDIFCLSILSLTTV